MGLDPVTQAAIITFLTAAATTTVQVSKQTSAKKKTASQVQQAERIRAGEIKRAEALVAKGELLETEAAKSAAVAAGRKKQRIRSTLATGPKGLLTEPELAKPSLLGA